MPQRTDEPGGGRKDLMMIAGPPVSLAEMAEERRRRAGSRRLSIIWAEYANNALRGRVGRSNKQHRFTRRRNRENQKIRSAPA